MDVNQSIATLAGDEVLLVVQSCKLQETLEILADHLRGGELEGNIQCALIQVDMLKKSMINVSRDYEITLRVAQEQIAIMIREKQDAFRDGQVSCYQSIEQALGMSLEEAQQVIEWARAQA